MQDIILISVSFTVLSKKLYPLNNRTDNNHFLI